MRTALASFSIMIVLCAGLFAQPNAVPFVNQPLVPASVAPGGAGFTLTVNGTGFVSGSTVNWNGSPRTTTFVSSSQVTAAILSSDIATASTASVTVVSPAPGGGASNIVFLPVREPSTFVSLNATSFGGEQDPSGVVGGDFNKDGNQDLAIISYPSGEGPLISILLGNGDGTFRQGFQYNLYTTSASVLTADVNGDGNLDLLLPDAYPLGGNNSLGVMLGNGDGTFQQPMFFPGASCCYGGVFGDFNRDGALDFAVSNSDQVCVLPGTGTGAFGQEICTSIPSGQLFYLTAGDFNSDGKLDLALTGNFNGPPYFLAVMLGNGDGTFQKPQMYTTPDQLDAVTTADFNGDGVLDLAIASYAGNEILLFLGNGDGTFRAPMHFATPFEPFFVEAADMNGDGKLDLLVTDYGYDLASVSVLLGNGDGTFQPYEGFGASSAFDSSVADFNNDGKLDLAAPNGGLNTTTILTQDNGSVIVPSPQQLVFSTQLVGSVSSPKLITLTNTGTVPVNVSQVAIGPNFSQLNSCRLIQPNASCKIGVYFTPTTQGNLTGNLSITDNGGGSPQILNLSGVATIVGVKPASLNFGDEPVGHISKPQNVEVTNEGNGPMIITKIGIGGADPKDFSEVNACPSKLAAGASCEITVIFHPTEQGARDATLGIFDNGGGSPQQVPLSGTGT